jgi:hypothetical protein
VVGEVTEGADGDVALRLSFRSDMWMSLAICCTCWTVFFANLSQFLNSDCALAEFDRDDMLKEGEPEELREVGEVEGAVGVIDRVGVGEVPDGGRIGIEDRDEDVLSGEAGALVVSVIVRDGSVAEIKRSGTTSLVD